jgi:lambda family phage portal protein
MNLIDSMVGVFSPQSELRRTIARKHLGMINRNYDAATYSNKTKGWFAPNTSMQVETKTSLPILRDRSRELLRNAPVAVRALDALTHSVIGGGIVPTLIYESESQKRIIEPLLKRFIDTCSFEEGLDFYGLQALAFRSMLECGEILIKFIRTKDVRTPLQLQLLESDFIDPFREGYLASGGYISQGVEFGADFGGKPVAYYMYRNHPGGFLFNSISGESLRIPASDIVHCFRRIRPGQTRGIPFLAPVMLKIRDLDSFSAAHLTKAKLSACYAMFVRDLNEQLDMGTQEESQKDETIQPGTVTYLPYGKDVVFSDPPESPHYGEYVSATLREICQGLGISFEALSQDYSKVNFSSARMGWLEYHRTIQSYQWGTVIPALLTPIMNEFLRTLQLQGVDTRGVSFTFTPPRREMLDPTSEIKAMKEGMRSGIFSLSECIRELGYDPKERLLELSEDKNFTEILGLKLESFVQEVADAQESISDPDQDDQESSEPDTQNQRRGGKK